MLALRAGRTVSRRPCLARFRPFRFSSSLSLRRSSARRPPDRSVAGRFRGRDAVLSGPAGGTVAGIRLGDAANARDVITVDMGGTSFDICLINDGQPTVSTDSWVNRYRVAIPALDIHALGAASDFDKTGESYWAPAFAGYEWTKAWEAEQKPDEVILD